MYRTEQEEFWSGQFGNNYVDRNVGDELIANNIYLFSKILSKCVWGGIKSIIEFGANIGLNLRAIKSLLPVVECSAVEINKKASAILKSFLPDERVYETSILEYNADLEKEKYDMVLIKGVLIHINPEELDNVYEKLYKVSRKYICVVEYYNPTPVSVVYRGHKDRLFKRDFAGDLLDKYMDLRLVDYGFVYHRDDKFPQDDLTWFLLEKKI